MPQMSPYNWLTLNILMITILIMYITLFYFNYVNKNITQNQIMKFSKKFNLKW